MKITNKISEHIKRILSETHPAKLALFGYMSYIVIGWILLSLPFSQNGYVKSIDNLFTATSAVSTTGLITVSLSDNYSFIGQLIVMILIQLGGIGYMTFGSFILLSRKAPLSETRNKVSGVVFSLPNSFKIDKFIRSVIKFTLIIETIGAILLYVVFLQAGTPSPVWNAIFHSISAFCTAGFSLFNDSFVGFQNNVWLNIIIAVLSYLGAVGFIVCVDYWRVLKGKAKSVTLTSKIIIWATVWFSIGGTLLIFINEPSIQNLSADNRLIASFFQAMTAMTTVGFNTINISELSKATLLLTVVLMLIGASPSGTGGGLKSTTVTAFWGVMKSAINGKQEVRFWNKAIPLERVWIAIASVGFYLVALVIGTYFLEMTEKSSFVENAFEAVSAIGTVGLSMGITATLSSLGKFILVMLMFAGRLSPLTFGIALFCHDKKDDDSDNDLAV